MAESSDRSISARLSLFVALAAPVVAISVALAVSMNKSPDETPIASAARVVPAAPDQRPTLPTVVIGSATSDAATPAERTTTSLTTTTEAGFGEGPPGSEPTPTAPGSTTPDPTTPIPTTTAVAPPSSSTTTTPATVTSAPTTTVAPTTTPPPTTTLDAGYLAQAYLSSNGEGPAAWLLPVAERTTQQALPNFDSNLNADPGRTIVRSDDLSGPAMSRSQLWRLPVEEDFHATGTPRLEIWAAAADFDPGATIELTAALASCQGFLECEDLGSRTVSFAQQGFGGDFGRVSISFPAIDHVIPSGHYLLIGLTVPAGSDADAWVAFDSPTYPSRAFLD